MALTPEQVREARIKYGIERPSPSSSGAVNPEERIRQLKDYANQRTSPKPLPKTLSGFLGNAVKSTGDVVKGIAGAVTSPVQTLKGAANLAGGIARKVTPDNVERMLGGDPDNDPNNQEAMVDALVDFYKNRYGSLRKAADAVYDDPAGVALDIATVLGGGGAIVGKLGTAAKANTLVKLGKGLEKAANLVDPAQGVAQGLGKTLSTAQKGSTGLAEKTRPLRTEVASRVSGVERNILEQAYKEPAATEAALNAAKIAPKSEYYQLTKNLATKIKGLKAQAKEAFTEAKKPFVEQGKTFDLSQRVSDIAKSVNRSSESVKLKQLRDKSGKLTTKFEITGVPDQKVASVLNQTIEKVRTAKNLKPDEIISLKKFFNEQAKKLPLQSDGSKSFYHTVLKSIENKTLQAANELLPRGLQEAYGQYRSYYDVYEKLGKKLFDGKGNLRPTAEAFLKSTTRENKAAVRVMLDEVGDSLGLNINKEIERILNAQKVLKQDTTSRARLQMGGLTQRAIDEVQDLVANRETTVRRVIQEARGSKSTVKDAGKALAEVSKKAANKMRAAFQADQINKRSQ